MDQISVQLLLQIDWQEELDREPAGLSEDRSRSGDNKQPRGAGEGLFTCLKIKIKREGKPSDYTLFLHFYSIYTFLYLFNCLVLL